MRVHNTDRVMNACRECLCSIYCRLAQRKKTLFCGKIVNFNKNSTTLIVINLRKKEKMRKEITGEQESVT